MIPVCLPKAMTASLLCREEQIINCAACNIFSKSLYNCTIAHGEMYAQHTHIAFSHYLSAVCVCCDNRRLKVRFMMAFFKMPGKKCHIKSGENAIFRKWIGFWRRCAIIFARFVFIFGLYIRGCTNRIWNVSNRIFRYITAPKLRRGTLWRREIISISISQYTMQQ